MQPGDEILRARSAFNPQLVLRRGDMVVRDAAPWTPSVHALLRHLEARGIEAPRVVGTGFDADGMEMVTYLQGEVDSKRMWSRTGARALGSMLRRLHEATADYPHRPNDLWFPWRGRRLGRPRVIGHCDAGPWNIVRKDGIPIAFIDWTRAGPVDPVVELAHACWLNAHLHDDVVAEVEELPPIEERSKHLRAIVDGYGLEASQREDFIDLMIAVAVFSAADDADQAGINRNTMSSEAPQELVWALSWQTRGAAWQIENKERLRAALL